MRSHSMSKSRSPIRRMTCESGKWQLRDARREWDGWKEKVAGDPNDGKKKTVMEVRTCPSKNESVGKQKRRTGIRSGHRRTQGWCGRECLLCQTATWKHFGRVEVFTTGKKGSLMTTKSTECAEEAWDKNVKLQEAPIAPRSVSHCTLRTQRYARRRKERSSH